LLAIQERLDVASHQAAGSLWRLAKPSVAESQIQSEFRKVAWLVRYKYSRLMGRIKQDTFSATRVRSLPILVLLLEQSCESSAFVYIETDTVLMRRWRFSPL